MESVIVKASKTVEVNNIRTTYNYETTIPSSFLYRNCLNQNVLNYLTEFMQNLIGDEEEDE